MSKETQLQTIDDNMQSAWVRLQNCNIHEEYGNLLLWIEVIEFILGVFQSLCSIPELFLE